MSKNLTFDIDFTDEIIDDFGETESKKVAETEAPKEAVRPIHAKWSIVKAFNIIYMCTPKSRLGKELFIRCAEAFSYLNKTMGLTAVQCVIIAMLIEEGKAMSTRQMGKILGVTHLSMMTHHNDIEALFRKHWLNHRTLNDRGEKIEAYVLAKGVIDAIRENRVFEAERLDCADSQELVETLAKHFVNGLACNNVDFQDEVFWIEEFVNANKQLPLCKVALAQGSLENMAMLMLIVADYFNYNGSENEGLDRNAIELVYADCHHFVMNMMECGEHPLFTQRLLEHKCEDGLANTSAFVASSHLKDEVLKDVTVPNHAEKGSPKMNGDGCSTTARALGSNCVVGDAYKLDKVEIEHPSDFNLPRNGHFEFYARYIQRMLNEDDNEDELTHHCVSTFSVAPPSPTSDLAAHWQQDELMTALVNDVIRDVKSWGSLSGSLVDQIIASTKARIDYRKVLASFRASVLSQSRKLTRMRPNRRSGFDAMGSRYDFTTSMIIGVDVSGSIQKEDLQHFYSTINRFFQYGIRQIDVVQFDTQLGSVTTLSKATEKIKITGRGGTCFQPFIDYVAEHPEYDGALIYTDGYAPQPTIPTTMRTPLCWIVRTEEQLQKHEAWMRQSGRVCVIETS